MLGVVHTGPALVVFGDSRAEAAVDTRQLSAALSRVPLAYNLSWHAQGLDHAILLYQRLARETGTVIQFVSLPDLASEKPCDPRIGVAMRIYGWTPAQSDVVMMQRAFGDLTPEYMTASHLRIASQARWGLRQFADVSLRQKLRRDLLPDRERSDLFFPSPYETRLNGSSFSKVLATVAILPPHRTLSRSRARLLEHIAEQPRRIIILLPPLHHALLLEDHDRRVAALRAFANQIGLQVIDGSRWVADDDFADPLHVNVAGARVFTAKLAATLEGRR